MVMKVYSLYMSKCFCIVFLLLVQHNVDAQTILNLQEAYEIALQNNFSIRVAQNDVVVTRNNNQIGNAGMLPTVLGTVNQDKQIVNTRQHFLTGTENNRNNAKSTFLNANVELGWTVFNGMKMFVTREKLQELEVIGGLRLRQQIEQIFSRVAKAYYDAVINKQQIKSSKTFIDISEKRLKVAEAKVLAGKSAKSEVLLAKVNLNSDKAALMRLQTLYKNSKLSLNQLMAKEITFDYEVADTILLTDNIKLDDVRNKAFDQNTGVQISKVNQKVNYLQVKEIRSERFPLIQLRSGYNYSQQKSEAGFVQSASNNGYHFGGGLSLNIFNGFDVNRRLNNAQLLYRSSELLYKDSLSKLDMAVTQAYNTYATNIELWHFELTNLDVAQQNFSIAKDQNDQGVISSNDLRIAQVNLLQNINRLLIAAYDARLSEVELQRLSGGLIKGQ